MGRPLACRDDTDAPPPVGELVRCELRSIEGEHYLLFRPENPDDRKGPIVFVHGYSRRAHAQAGKLRSLCAMSGRTLIAPLFSAATHPRYQRLGYGACGRRADAVLIACLEDAEQRTGCRVDDVVLIGYSGGAQFAHRFAMAHPQRLLTVIAVAAGWYTLPVPHLRYPGGLQATGRSRDMTFNPEHFLRVPMHVIVGAEDTGTRNLRMSSELNRTQGSTRVERARRWVATMRLAAESFSLPPRISYREIPGMGHSFSRFVAEGMLLTLIGATLEDAPGNVGPIDAAGDIAEHPLHFPPRQHLPPAAIERAAHEQI